MSMDDIYDVINGLIAGCDNTILSAQLDDLRNPDNEAVLLTVIKALHLENRLLLPQLKYVKFL